ncbi:MAG: methyltransferase domain-containing protein [Oligoflexia bacterium]|nr:methyltransferase domain-containing protein [Oligoflexia bacterium]
MTRDLKHLKPFQRPYEYYASVYDWVCGWVFGPGRKAAVGLLAPEPGARVLEVGVGTGASLLHYPEEVRVTGIDICEPMLKEARKRVERESLKHIESLDIMDAQAMAFADDSFDAVVAMHVATVVPEPARFVDEMRRVCKLDGKIVIVTYFDQKDSLIGRAASLLAPVLGKILGFRPRISYDEFIKMTKISPYRRSGVNFLKLWSILEITNDKVMSTAAQNKTLPQPCGGSLLEVTTFSS